MTKPLSDWDSVVRMAKAAKIAALHNGDEVTVRAIAELIRAGDAESKSLRDMLIVVRSYLLADEDVRFIADKERLLEDISKVITKSLTGE